MLDVSEPAARAAAPHGPPAVRARHGSLMHRGLGGELLWVAATALLALVAIALDLHLWDASLHVPFGGTGGDTSLAITVVKGALEHGWVFTNPDIGYPGGTQFYDFPAGFGDVLHLLIMQVIGLVSDDPVAVINVFYVLGYPLAAATTFGVMRSLGIPRSIALVCGVLYALLPFHMLRGESHLTLSAYFAVPLACWLILGGMGVQDLFARATGDVRRVRAWLSPRSVATVVLAVVAGLSGLYYALFAVVLLVLTAPIAFLAHRSRATLAQAAVAAAILFGVTAACQLPAVVYQRANGKNAAVGTRLPLESEVYGLKLAHLVFPRPGHRVGALSRLGTKYGNNPVPAEGFSPSLGIAGVIGLAAILVALLAGGMRPATDRGRLRAAAGLAALTAFLMGTVGGGSALFAYTVSGQIRAWNRISVYIAFFALVGLALLLVRLRDRLSGPRRWAFGGVLVLVGVLGALDQTSSLDRPDYAAARGGWANDGRFVALIERQLPAGGPVLQLPYVPFPENPSVVNMGDYDEFKGYVHSTDLKWTYGEIKGRPADWADDAQSLPTDRLVYAAAAAGFVGIYVDQAGYADGGARVTKELATMTGATPISSQDQRLLFYPLTGVRAQAEQLASPELLSAAGSALTHPVSSTFVSGFYSPEVDPNTGVEFHWAPSDAILRLENPGRTPRRVQLSGELAGAVAGTLTKVTMFGPGSVRRVYVADAKEPVALSQGLVVPPGGADLRFHADGPRLAEPPPSARDLRMRLLSVSATAEPINELQRRLSGRR